MQYMNGDNIREDHVTKIKDTATINSGQNNCLLELKAIWQQWDESIKIEFYKEFVNIALLLDIQIDQELIRAMNQYWDSSYNLFTFGEVDVMPTLEEYEAQVLKMDNVRMRPFNFPTFRKMLKAITGKKHGSMEN
ncbi:hypothetical protein GQ457_02G040990 [Hibiscus cannabinus]